MWKPDLLLINANLTPWMLEMILALPNALFFVVFWWLRLLPPDGVISPGQLDIVEGRKSMLDWHFAELVQVRFCILFFCSVCLFPPTVAIDGPLEKIYYSGKSPSRLVLF